MSEHNGLRHFVACVARTFHLWPLISKTGIYNYARRKKYPDTLVFLDVVITECCSLKCRNCSNLMQYYHKPENLDPEEVINSLRRIFGAVRVSQLKILGGEPFVCQKTLMRTLEYLREEALDRFDEVEIITNGTIIPSEECLRVMKETPKLKVLFSNYGELSSRLDEFMDICRKESINCDVTESLTTNSILRYFDSALIADHALKSDLLIFTAAAFPGFCRSEDLLAEESVYFWSLSTIVDGLRLFNFTV